MTRYFFRKHFFVLLMLISNQIIGQNLVKNPGFEITTGMPTIAGQGYLVADWDTIGYNIPELYDNNQTVAGPTPCDNVGIPYNSGGYCTEDNGNNHYVGLSFNLNNGYREYFTSKLKVPLLPGEIYRVEMNVQRADKSRYSCNRIGALLTIGKPSLNSAGQITLFPQIETPNQVTDTADWVTVAGVFQAIGGEEYITFGLFRPDSYTGLQKTDYGTGNSGCTEIDAAAYYYFDDIVVRPVNIVVEITGDTIVCPGQSTILTANANVPYWWSVTGNPADTFSIAPSITVTPNGPFTYYLCSEFSQPDFVIVQTIAAPVINLIPDTFLCETDSLILDPNVADGIQYYWSTTDTTPTITVRDTGTYVVTVDNLGCSATDSVVIPGYLSNPQVPLGDDSLYCFFYYDTLRLDAGPGTAFSWNGPGISGLDQQLLTIIEPGEYSVTVTRNNGCIRNARMFVDESCDPVIFVPNAFTPDDDGINDVFKPFVNNVIQYNFRVYNRRGQEVFKSEDSESGWDGRYNGEEAPIGVYAYRINYTGLDFEGIKVKKKVMGIVTLLR